MVMLKICKKLKYFMIRGIAFHFLMLIYNILDYNIIAMEYPGYGIYKSNEISQTMIEEDAEALYLELIN